MADGDYSHDLAKRPDAKIQFTQALQKVVDYLKPEPLLLFVLGAAIVLAAASAWAGPNLWTLSFGLILLIVIGLVTWVFLEI